MGGPPDGASSSLKSTGTWEATEVQQEGEEVRTLTVQRRPKWEGFKPDVSRNRKPELTEVDPSLPRLKEILVATDLGLGGTVALTTARALAHRAGANLSVINVVKPVKYPELFYPPDERVSDWLRLRQVTAQELLTDELAEMGLGSARTHVTEGDPGDQVIAFATESRADLIVVGAPSSSRLKKTFDGSAGERIVRHSPCPVLVTRGNSGRPFEKLLVAVDLSFASKRIIHQAGRLAECDRSDVLVAYSEECSTVLRRKLTFAPRLGRKITWGRLETLLQASDLPQFPISTILRGHAGRAVLEEARRWDADLIVMGVRRLSFPLPTRLGWTARYVLRHGDRSVLFVPS
jgi:nucleotide-binding universal stress UspA family protein